MASITHGLRNQQFFIASTGFILAIFLTGNHTKSNSNPKDTTNKLSIVSQSTANNGKTTD